MDLEWRPGATAIAETLPALSILHLALHWARIAATSP